MLFAVNPMIVMYAASGMSEAPFLFFVLWATRRLIRWMRSDDVHDLIGAGLAFALAYLTRYDALAPLFVAVVLVTVVSWLRFRPTAEERGEGAGPGLRLWAAALDGAVVLMPGFLAFALWSFASWLITGQAFQQFVVGLREQFHPGAGWCRNRLTDRPSSRSRLPKWPYSARRSRCSRVLAIIYALRRRDTEVVVPLVLFGAIPRWPKPCST